MCTNTGLRELHDLDARSGDRLFSMEWTEVQSAVYPQRCTSYRAFIRRPGVSRRYAQRHDTDELQPFQESPLAAPRIERVVCWSLSALTPWSRGIDMGRMPP